MTKLTDAQLRASVDALTENKSQRKAAKVLGISQASLHSRLATAKEKGLIDQAQIDRKGGVQGGAKIGGDEQSRKIVHLQDEVSRLQKAVKDAHRDTTVAEIVREMIGRLADAPVEPPEWLVSPIERPKSKPEPEVPNLIVSDIHGGEVVKLKETNGVNEYNMAIAEERTHKTFEKAIFLSENHHSATYPGIVIDLLGDNVSGGIHDELKKTDEEEVIPCVLAVRDWLHDGIRRSADHFGRVYLPCACGNHGRLTHRPEFKKYYQKNWDYLIYSLLIRDFADDKRIVFDMRPSNDVYYRVYNERYLACHGDMLGVKGGDGIIGSIGPIMRGEVKQSGQSSAMGRPFDKIIIGHWHQRLWLPRAIVNNAVKGFDEFAMKGLGAKPDRPTQTLWFVHGEHGITSHWDIYLTKSPKVSTEWVTWKEAA